MKNRLLHLKRGVKGEEENWIVSLKIHLDVRGIQTRLSLFMNVLKR